MPSIPTITLNDGAKIPVIGFGTGTALRDKDAAASVEQALKSGFTHIDAAQIYNNESSVGAALGASAVDRSQLYLTTKYGGGGTVSEEFHTSLSKLGVTSVDLYLIHHPQFVDKQGIEGAWADVEKLQAAGLTTSIGVSNFSAAEVQRVLDSGKVTPSVNQIRFHPYNYSSHKALLELCSKHSIVVEAFGILAPITQSPGGAVTSVIESIAKRINGTPAQVLFKWALAKGVVVITTTNSQSRLDEYLAVLSLHLTETEVAAIDEAGALGVPASGKA
ncbi:Aldo/keto reductase [Auriscalpium vulgare]|uniref:Aldo/keto reductase n=1 Tax=Auriscalpium vulgare TaxID=40419 RepID=A0ACB8RJG0_9AGAM|nr:Aldo/keto reductase [Auriscalpium vulgare]